MAEKRTTFGEASYRTGALERLADAYLLLNAEQFAGSIYLAGRSVEGMLRSLVWKSEPEIQQQKKSLETGHDFRKLLSLIRNLGLLRAGEIDVEFESHVQHVGRLWFNNMRFASSKNVETIWRGIGEVRKGWTLKQASADFYNACSAIIKRCEVLCQRHNFNKH